MAIERKEMRDLIHLGLSRYVDKDGTYHAIDNSSRYPSETDLDISEYPVAYRNFRENGLNIFQLRINPQLDRFTREQLDAAFAQVFSERPVGSSLDINIRLLARAEYILDRLHNSIEKFSGR